MQIENAVLRVKAKTLGAELVSIFDKRDNTEHLWQAHPEFWAAHAPVLFPIVGRSFNDTLLFDGVSYPMEKHGFARRNEFQLMELQEGSMTFELCANESLKQMYPFDFSFCITYSILENSLITTYTVTNKGNTTMPFAVGGHPAFAVPFFADEAYEDYAMVFENDTLFTRHHINAEGLFDGRTSLMQCNGQSIPLVRDLFANDALVFKDLQSKSVRIVSRKHNKQLRVDFAGFPYLGIWAKTSADYVCIEPWIGCADADGFTEDFTKKEQVVLLEAGNKFRVAFGVTLELTK
jgi:galactose mutarotase-like enzyme